MSADLDDAVAGRASTSIRRAWLRSNAGPNDAADLLQRVEPALQGGGGERDTARDEVTTRQWLRAKKKLIDTVYRMRWLGARLNAPLAPAARTALSNHSLRQAGRILGLSFGAWLHHALHRRCEQAHLAENVVPRTTSFHHPVGFAP